MAKTILRDFSVAMRDKLAKTTLRAFSVAMNLSSWCYQGKYPFKSLKISGSREEENISRKMIKCQCKSFSLKQ